MIKAPERDVVQGRGGTQVVLDLANPQVQEFIFKIVDDLMSNYPEIDYIKWDANMSILNHGSNYLTKDNQSHMYIEFHRALRKYASKYALNIRTLPYSLRQRRRSCQLWHPALLR